MFIIRGIFAYSRTPISRALSVMTSGNHDRLGKLLVKDLLLANRNALLDHQRSSFDANFLILQYTPYRPESHLEKLSNEGVWLTKRCAGSFAIIGFFERHSATVAEADIRQL